MEGTDKFDEKDPSEVILLGFDFSNLTTLITGTPSVVCTRIGGKADNNPASMVLGAAAVQSGYRVVQRIQGGVNGTDYELRCTVSTSDNQTFVKVGHLPVRRQKTLTP